MSSVYESKPWLERYTDYVPKELPLPTKSMADLFEESVERAPSAMPSGTSMRGSPTGI